MSFELFTDINDNMFSYDESEAFNSQELGKEEKYSTKKNKLLFFDKLKREYFKIKEIAGYDKIQDKLYNGMNKKEIIEFEIVRILNNSNGNVLISERLVTIQKLLKMYDEELPVDVYEKIVSLIIKMELSLGMKIGLFNELCMFYEKERDIMNKKFSYVKKK